MKKRYIIVPAVAAFLWAICADSSELPGGFEKSRVFSTAKDFISKLNSGRFGACFRQLSPVMKASMNEDRLEATFRPIIASLGSFIRFRGISVSVKKSGSNLYATCIVKCQYEKELAVFTILFDQKMQVSGLSIK